MFPLVSSCHLNSPEGDTCPLTKLWMFALILDLGGHQRLINDHGFNDDAIARYLGLNALLDERSDEAPDRQSSFRQRAMRLLKQQRQQLKQQHLTAEYPDPLKDNLSQLGCLIGLDDLEQRLLGFCALLHTDGLLEDACCLLEEISFNRALVILAHLLDAPRETIRQRLAKKGLLVLSGLLDVATYSGRYRRMGDILNADNSSILSPLRYQKGTPVELFSNAFRKALPGHLGHDDYRHIKPALAVALPYLRHALATRRPGVNILVYGPPGTGKSQLARLLAKELEVDLYEVACTDCDGDPINRYGRLRALRSAMRVLCEQRALLVLDEIEDLFNESNATSQWEHASGQQKNWINRVLEENPLPCFWLTNKIQALDRAYLRRFDMVLELGNPPKAQRELIIYQNGGDLLSDHLITKLAGHEQATPAVITRALNIAKTLAESPEGPALDTTVEQLVDATLHAQGFNKLERSQAQRLPEFYSPHLVNADMPLETLLDGLRQHSEARLCFYGPPGTGKTAFGQWLARELEKPLLVKRASDLIGPYVGETERNLAQAFQQAREDGAVLMLDEIDSFLRDRRKAQHSWEITAVNEMLTQMESYQGLLIASTNLMDDLDDASLRRFDLKICFDFLRPEQAMELFNQHLRQLKLAPAPAELMPSLGRLNRLTPGDFAMISRRAQFKSFKDANELLEALHAECCLKERGHSRPIGFIH